MSPILLYKNITDVNEVTILLAYDDPDFAFGENDRISLCFFFFLQISPQSCVHPAYNSESRILQCINTSVLDCDIFVMNSKAYW